MTVWKNFERIFCSMKKKKKKKKKIKFKVVQKIGLEVLLFKFLLFMYSKSCVDKKCNDFKIPNLFIYYNT